MASVADICNLALSHLGDWRIADLSDTSKQGKECSRWYALSRDELLRSHRWNFAVDRKTLRVDWKDVTGVEDDGGFIKVTVVAHGFAVGDAIRIDQVEGVDIQSPGVITAITTDNFTLDTEWPGGTYVSGGRASVCPPFGWDYRVAKPADFLRMFEINGEYVELSEDYVIESGFILSDNDVLECRYLRAETDTTKFDTLFVSALAIKLAANICKSITSSDGKREELLQLFKQTINDAIRVDAIENKAKVVQPEDDRFVKQRRLRQLQ